MSSDLDKFVADLNCEVLDRAADGEASHEAVFTELMLEYLSDSGIVENSSTSFFEGRVGRGIAKINGYAVGDDEDVLDLFITVFLNAAVSTRIPADEIRKGLEQAVRYGNAALQGLHETMDPTTEPYSMSARIYELRKKIERIRIVLLTDGVVGSSAGKIPDRKTDKLVWKFELWDAERLSRLRQSGTLLDELDIDLETFWGAPIPCVSMAGPVTEYQVHLAILPGELLFRLYDEFGARLMERNVRSFLQAKGKVNKGIRDTLRNEPTRFMAYNNGISITAQEVALKPLADGKPGISRIKGLQIVNGGQTTASIHRARKSDKADLSAVFVPAKISVIPGELLDSLAPRIAEFANTQNPIQMADFSANDPFHIELERLSKSIWIPGEQGKWFYERARGQYHVAQSNEGTTPARLRQFKERTPPSRRFSKIDLAKYLNSWDQLPHLVSQGGQMNFVLFTQRLRETRPKGWLPDEAFYKELIAKAILFKEAVRIVRSEDFPAYRANIVTYLVATLAFKSAGKLDLKLIWDEQNPSVALESLMRKWSHPVADAIIASAEGRNVTQWAKKFECWKAVMMLNLPVPDPLPPEFQTTEVEHRGWGVRPELVRVPLDPDVVDAIAVCRATEPSDWITILDWAQRTGKLDQSQRQTATALAALAATAWAKEPSAKHAKEGRHILNLARESGVLDGVRYE